LVGDYPTITNQVGMAASPVWAGNTLVIPMDNDGESFLAGIDPVSGRNRWKVDRPKDINWVSPIVRQLQGQAEVLFQNKSEITAYDAETGKVRWSYTGTGLSTIPSPAIDGDRVLVPAGELISIKPGTGTPEVVWKSTRLAPRGYPSPLVYQGRIYSINSAGVLVCAKAGDGTVLWQERLKSGGPFAASPVAADGKIYVVNEKGICSVVRAGDKPEVLASNDLGDEVLATPALVNGAIFLRTDKHLYCIGSSN
jgi:outer membrane protein assembly factor BamB